MSSSAVADRTPTPVSQRELLGLVMGCAARRSATFAQAEFAVIAGGGTDERARAIARELLTDLSIRDWIEIRLRYAGGGEGALARRLWELEFSAERNWDGSALDCACYALTDKGRGRLLRTAGR